MWISPDICNPLAIDPCGMDQYNNAMGQIGDGGGFGCNASPPNNQFYDHDTRPPPVALPLAPERDSFDLMANIRDQMPPITPAPEPVYRFVPEPIVPIEPEPFYLRPDIDRVIEKIGRFEDY